MNLIESYYYEAANFLNSPRYYVFICVVMVNILDSCFAVTLACRAVQSARSIVSILILLLFSERRPAMRYSLILFRCVAFIVSIVDCFVISTTIRSPCFCCSRLLSKQSALTSLK